MENTVKKVTKAMRFEDISAVLQGKAAPNGSNTQDMLDFISHEVELLARKNKSDSKEPTPAQKENNKLMELIMEYLSQQDKAIPYTEIRASIPELAAFEYPKTVSLLTKLCEAGRIVKTKGAKNKNQYAIA